MTKNIAKAITGLQQYVEAIRIMPLQERDYLLQKMEKSKVLTNHNINYLKSLLKHDE